MVSKTEDEISTLLRHFRPRPRFSTSCTSSTEIEWHSHKRKRTHDRGYSSVKYDARHGKILLTFHHVQTTANRMCLYLVFEMVLPTKSIACIRCSGPNISISDFVKQRVDSICRDELSFGNSLFSVASRLLEKLNRDLPKIDAMEHGFVEPESFQCLIQRSAQLDSNRRIVQMCHLIDMYTLLLRCAAAGRTRSQTLSPVPMEYSSVACGDRDALAHLVFNASNELYTCGFRDCDRKHQPTGSKNGGWKFLSFILSLPIIDGQLLKDAKSTPNKAGNKATKSIVGKVTLDLNLDDPSPSFTKHASKYGTLQTYHGTKIESTWSILNHGLQNLSNNKVLSQNGAMMGEGVYLTSSFQVAERFAIMAAEQPSRALSFAFEHESLLHLLTYANVDIAKLDALNTYDIKCLPVFEATIIKPHENDVEFNKTITRQEGKYFVCEDSEFVRVTKLHLTIELTKKGHVIGWLPRVPFSLIVFLVVMIWSFCSV